MLNARLPRVALRASDLDRTWRFYEDHVGLGLLDPGPPGTHRLALSAGGHVLELSEGEGLHHFALEIDDERELERLIVRAQRSGARVAPVESDGDHPRGVWFVDSDGHVAQLHGRTGRNNDAAGGDRFRPVGIHHITLSTEDVPALVDFYVSVLGFVISDRMGDRFMWLRCNREHHTVAIVEGAADGLDHYCFEIRDWNELKVWCGDLAAGDVMTSWDPGRHGPGNNLFIMFDDPDGVHIELPREMERFWDGTVTYPGRRDWAAGMRTVNLWGPTSDWRRSLEPEEVSL